MPQNWLKLITKVLNELIGLNGYDYYSKVLKTIKIKLTKYHFLVVITPPNRLIASPLAMEEIKTKVNYTNMQKKNHANTPKNDMSGIMDKHGLIRI